MERDRSAPGGTAQGAPVRAGRGWSRAAGTVVVVGFLLGYGVAFPAMYRVMGTPTPVVSVIIVLLGGALLGARGGVVTALGCEAVNVGLLRWVGDRNTTVPALVVAGLVLVVIGALVGQLRELGVLLRRSHAELEQVLAEAHAGQRALAERDALVAQAQALAHIGYFVLDLETRESSWSSELCRIMGEDPETYRSSEQAWWQHVHPQDRALLERNGSRSTVEDGQIQNEFRIVRADGKIRWVFGRVQALRDERGRPVKLLGTLQDLTEHRELQAQLTAAERLATVGTLAAGVAHEINNPLASVISNLEFVLEGLGRLPPASSGPAAPELQAAAGEALQGADRVSHIVRDLMAFSRPTEQPGPVDLERVLDLSVNMAAAQTRYRARLVKQYGHVPPANGDAARLGQVFLNLLVNAAQAIPEGRPERHEIRVTTRVEGDRVAVSIRDTGAGMTPEVKRRVFEPFFTTRPAGAGLGLGLSTSLAIVRALGGNIEVESEPAQGSTFTVVLPAALPGPAQAASPAPADERRGRVLIIGEEPAAVADVARQLGTGPEIRHAQDGAAGLELLASGGPFDAVLCDLTMPGMSGPEVHEAVLGRDPQLASRMVFLADGGLTPAARDFLARTPNRVMSKPLGAEALRALLREEQGRA